MTPKDTILIVDDDPSLRSVLRTLLEVEGFNVLQAVDGDECMRLAYAQRPSLILLDIMMPNKDGREVCKSLREVSDVPIIMLTCLPGEKVSRLADGADDYVTKPFDNNELVARIRALLRRTRRAASVGMRSYQDGVLHVDFEAHQLRVNGSAVLLSPKEWRLLECLMQNKDRVATRQALLHYVWGEGYENDYNSLKVLVSHLRHKLQDSSNNYRYIHTARDMGYRFDSRMKPESTKD